MNRSSLFSLALFYTVLLFGSCTNSYRSTSNDDFYKISATEYYDKVYASWLGQIIGNIYGLPHENNYIEEPRPDSLSEFKYRGEPFERMLEVNGAFSDDDTDIEYMYVLQMEKHGITPTYAQLTEAWTYHVRDRIWLANRAALTAMKYGFTPPLTGDKRYNPHWFQIDPQLINEIWAITAPGMVEYARDKSYWAGRITNDDWGIEPTLHYAAMFSAAFFEKDVNKLIDIGVKALPENSRFAETIAEVKQIHNRYPDVNDWKLARADLHQKFYINEPVDTKTIWNANLNGACAILALLYGQGDFEITLDISTALGYDADNQAATMAGLLGVVHGTDGLPKEMLFPVDSMQWKKPFNDFYKNVSRHDLPDTKLTDMAQLTVKQAEKIILATGGKISEEGGEKFYWINKNASFTPPLELSVVPNLTFEVGQPLQYAIISTIPAEELEWQVSSGTLPEGIQFEKGSLTGTPTATGAFEISITASSVDQEVSVLLNFMVLEKNLAMEAKEIVTNVEVLDKERRDKMWVTVSKNLLSDDVSIINDGKWSGDHSVFYSVMATKEPHEDFYGYVWEAPQHMEHVMFRTGPMEENGSWFESLRVEYLDASLEWREVDEFDMFPKLDTTNNPLNKAHFMNYHLKFKPVSSTGIRIIGKAGNRWHHRPNSRDIHYTSITELAVYPPLD